jgi:hypothetical protein
MGYDQTGNGSGCGSSAAPRLQNMKSNLVDTGAVNLQGYYWSSTELSGNQGSDAWLQYFASGGGSAQPVAGKFLLLSARCSRALTP